MKEFGKEVGKNLIISLVFSFIERFDLKRDGAQTIVVTSRENKPPLFFFARTVSYDLFTDMAAILNSIVRDKILWDTQGPNADMLLM